MTEEEKKAINNLWSSVTDVMFNVLYSQEQNNEDIKIALKLIQKQQKEIECLKQAGEATEKVYKAQLETAKQKEQFYTKLSKDNNYYATELEKKDKIIDEMAKELGKQFSSYEPCYLDNEIKQEECTRYKNCQDCIKQYFEKKVEGKQC